MLTTAHVLRVLITTTAHVHVILTFVALASFATLMRITFSLIIVAFLHHGSRHHGVVRARVLVVHTHLSTVGVGVHVGLARHHLELVEGHGLWELLQISIAVEGSTVRLLDSHVHPWIVLGSPLRVGIASLLPVVGRVLGLLLGSFLASGWGTRQGRV